MSLNGWLVVFTQCTVLRYSELNVVRTLEVVFILWVEMDRWLCVHSVLWGGLVN